MEILNSTFGGITLGTWCVIIFVFLGVRSFYRDWSERRRERKEFDHAYKKFKDDHVWQPMMVSGVDCGEWVRKDGQPVRD